MRQCLLFPQSWRDSHVYDKNARIFTNQTANVGRRMENIGKLIAVFHRYFASNKDVTPAGHGFKPNL
jgi:hypothetical protein